MFEVLFREVMGRLPRPNFYNDSKYGWMIAYRSVKTPVSVKVRRLHPGAIIPRYQHEGDAGFDLHFAGPEPAVLPPGRRALLSTGLSVEVPRGYELQVRPRSGWASREGITVLNSPGTVDSGYRGEVRIALINLGDRDVEVQPGTRIAQGVVAPVIEAVLEEVDELSETSRGDGGFGSTGTHP